MEKEEKMREKANVGMKEEKKRIETSEEKEEKERIKNVRPPNEINKNLHV